MSWRRFSALVAGLSFNSWWMRAVRRDNDPNAPRVISDPKAAEAWFSGIG
jgi:hypothetical protein